MSTTDLHFSVFWQAATQYIFDFTFPNTSSKTATVSSEYVVVSFSVVPCLVVEMVVAVVVAVFVVVIVVASVVVINSSGVFVEARDVFGSVTVFISVITPVVVTPTVVCT